MCPCVCVRPYVWVCVCLCVCCLWITRKCFEIDPPFLIKLQSVLYCPYKRSFSNVMNDVIPHDLDCLFRKHVCSSNVIITQMTTDRAGLNKLRRKIEVHFVDNSIKTHLKFVRKHMQYLISVICLKSHCWLSIGIC